MSYVFTAISVSYISILRSVTIVTMTMIVSIISLILKTAIGYTLIFGHFGYPALGVQGAAIGTAIGWTFECIVLVILVYARKTPLAASPFVIFNFSRTFLYTVLRTSLPAAINEVIWSFGITTYTAVYARIGTDSIAAININATVEELIFVLFIGLGNACSVMVGNKIGEKDKDTAYEYSRRSTILAVMLSIFGGVIVLLVRDSVVGLYQLSPSATNNLLNIMLVYAFSAWLRIYNFMMFIGALRAGGDTKYAMFTELFSIWVIGVPAALIGGFVLHLPVYYVYAAVLLEEIVKAIIVTRRYLSRKWIHDLVNVTGDEAPLLSTPEPAS
jgi:putative MATE family efflux protein